MERGVGHTGARGTDQPLSVAAREIGVNAWQVSARAVLITIAAAVAGVPTDAAEVAAAAGPAAPVVPAEAEITPNCVALPLPVVPSGPTWSFEVNTSGGSSPPAIVRGTFWRVPCATPGDAQLLLTFSPVSGIPFVCGGLRVVLVQNLLQSNAVSLDVAPDNGLVDSFCGSLLLPTTVVLNVSDPTLVFDDDASFSFVYLAGTSASPNAFVAVEAYDPSAYGEPAALQPFAGMLSGSYYDPARNGEGILLEIGQIGTRRVLFLTWFTYADGLQRWIVGNIDFPAGATEINVPLIVTSGGSFGAGFDPSQVTRSSWGSANVSFPTCTTMRFQWSETGGQAGDYSYQRLVESLEGISCP
jgi:hypothetical protein